MGQTLAASVKMVGGSGSSPSAASINMSSPNMSS